MNRIIPDSAAPGGTPDIPVPTGAREYASAAEQALRLLAHALTPPEVDEPQEVDEVLVELAQLGATLPQVVDTLCRGLLRLYNAGNLGHDEGLTSADLDREVDEAAETLSAAVRAAGAMATALDQARQITSHFTGGAR